MPSKNLQPDKALASSSGTFILNSLRIHPGWQKRRLLAPVRNQNSDFQIAVCLAVSCDLLLILATQKIVTRKKDQRPSCLTRPKDFENGEQPLSHSALVFVFSIFTSSQPSKVKTRKNCPPPTFISHCSVLASVSLYLCLAELRDFRRVAALPVVWRPTISL